MTVNMKAFVTDLPAYLILLLKAVAVRCFHQVDMLQEVGHADGGVQLPSLVRGLGSLTVVSSNVQKAALFCSRAAVVLVWKREVTVQVFHPQSQNMPISPLGWLKAQKKWQTFHRCKPQKRTACSLRRGLYLPVIGTMCQRSRKRTEWKGYASLQNNPWDSWSDKS